MKSTFNGLKHSYIACAIRQRAALSAVKRKKRRRNRHSRIPLQKRNSRTPQTDFRRTKWFLKRTLSAPYPSNSDWAPPSKLFQQSIDQKAPAQGWLAIIVVVIRQCMYQVCAAWASTLITLLNTTVVAVVVVVPINIYRIIHIVGKRTSSVQTKQNKTKHKTTGPINRWSLSWTPFYILPCVPLGASAGKNGDQKLYYTNGYCMFGGW